MLFQDFRHSLRLLRRKPGVNALVLQPRPGRIDRVVAVFTRDRVKARWRQRGLPLLSLSIFSKAFV